MFEIAAELAALVVPLGPAWQAALRQRPDLRLYVEDGSHPSKAGSYLAACVFYATLFDQGSIGLTVAESMRLLEDTAVFLHAIAARFRSSSSLSQVTAAS